MARLSVAIDARRLQDVPLGGVGRALGLALPGISDSCSVTLLADARRAPVATDLPQVALSCPRRLPEMVWLHWAVGRWGRRHGAVIHGTFNALPIGVGPRSVVTIYDLSFEVHPEDFGRAKREAFRLHARYAARRAGAVITASDFSADQITDCYRLPHDRIVVIPLGVDPLFGPEHGSQAPATASRLGIHGPYVAAVGGARRRGLDTALGAWRAVRTEGCDAELVVVGGTGALHESGVHDIGRVSDQVWAELLAGAEALCYPTRYEGWGMPALEAAASGTVVVCARVASLPEVLGEAAAWCEQPTVDAIAERLHAVLSDRSLAEDLCARGLARAASAPSWAEVARRHVETYTAVA